MIPADLIRAIRGAGGMAKSGINDAGNAAYRGMTQNPMAEALRARMGAPKMAALPRGFDAPFNQPIMDDPRQAALAQLQQLMPSIASSRDFGPLLERMAAQRASSMPPGRPVPGLAHRALGAGGTEGLPASVALMPELLGLGALGGAGLAAGGVAVNNDMQDEELMSLYNKMIFEEQRRGARSPILQQPDLNRNGSI